MSDIDPEICRMTKLDVRAEVGQPFEASATFQGEGVKMFAAHMAEWFRENRGDNFVTIDMSDPTSGERFELTMRRANGKTPAQSLADLRREIEDLRGVYEQPLDELSTRLPNVRPDFIVEVQTLSNAALQRRVLIQADWLGSYSRCLDDQDISMRIPGSGVQAARDPRNIRAIVAHMSKLLREIYDADLAAADELKKIGLPVELRFAHKIEDAIGLPSTRPRKVRS
jgi:hypothetical protein